MEPDEFRTKMRSALIALGPRAPANLSDIIRYGDLQGRERAIVRTADRSRPEQDRELEFPNGARLRFLVAFVKPKADWVVLRYSFHFSCKDGTWFRYERDSGRSQGMLHPLCHLHVKAEEPRYRTGNHDLLELLEFLKQQGLLS